MTTQTTIDPTVTFRSPQGHGYRHIVPIWGTVVVLDLRTGDRAWPDERLADAVEDAVATMRWVDDVFSSYLATSRVSALRSGRLSTDDLDPLDRDHAALLEVLAACRWGRQLTDGAFDPWAVPGGFDPSGYVKGWACEVVAERLVTRGIENLCINAGGDIVTRGQARPGEPWRVGIRHPDDPNLIVRVEEVSDAAVATSGPYERGDHIVDPATGQAARGARSATVVAPRAGLAEILSTALVVGGRDGAPWVAAQPGCRAYVVDPAPSATAWSTSAVDRRGVRHSA